MSCSFQLNRLDSASLLLVFLRTDDLLKRGLTTVAERQDACLELQKNFNCQELRYIRNGGRGSRAKGLRSVHLRMRRLRRTRREAGLRLALRARSATFAM